MAFGRPDAQGRGPVLERLFGRTVLLQSGETVTADEAYIRESILTPAARVTATGVSTATRRRS